MEFVVKCSNYYPITFRRDKLGMMQEVFEYRDSDGMPIKCGAALQQKLAEFADMWMVNINEQQHLGVSLQ